MAAPSLCSVASSSSSSPSYLSSLSRSSLSMQPTSCQSRPPTPPTPSIASLPSLAHSLSSFPTMTTVTKEMVHYGTWGRTKGASEAKLNTALQRTKQRQEASPAPRANPPFSQNVLYPPSEEDEPQLTMSRKHRVKRST